MICLEKRFKLMKKLILSVMLLGGVVELKGAPVPLNRFAAETVVPAVTERFPGGKFTMGEKETVVFVGGTNFVRESRTGEFEGLMVRAFAKEKPVIRSMAVDADTVYVQAREVNFGTWRGQLETVGATILVVQFGQMEALDGVEKLPAFVAAYHQLLDEFSTRTVRMVLVSPRLFEKPSGVNVPDLTKKNGDVKAYAEAVRGIAKDRGLIFVDLVGAKEGDGAKEVVGGGRLRDGLAGMTSDGIHLTDRGLRVVAGQMAAGLGMASVGPAVEGLERAILTKNRLWAQCWRPSNWNFAYGDRANQPFGRPAGGQPELKGAFAAHRGLLAEADARIAALALGEKGIGEVKEPAAVVDQKVLTPEEELETFTVADGYEVSLVASEEQGVVKPVQISWDEKGRLVVACSPSYPHLEIGAKPHDFVLVCELKGGKAVKSWKFAEGMTMVNGVEPGDGGMYVCDYDELVYLRDVDGDGRADERRVVMSGFGIGDTHQLINSINHGDEGSLWLSQGLHVRSYVETPWGISRLDQSGLWRLRPRTLRLDGYFNGARSSHNCWGVVVDDEGNIFHKGGDRPTGYYSQPGLFRSANGFVGDDYDRVGGIFQTDVKSVAIDIVGSKALPKEAQGCAVIAGFMASKVEMHRMIGVGSGFRSEQLPILLRSSNPAFRPVDVSQGPDGAIYVCDFYNPIIGHYQASYRDPKRDKGHGRIWRIRAKDGVAIEAPNLAGMDVAGLLGQLGSEERWTRYQAGRLLFWKPTGEVVKGLDEWVGKVTDEGLLRRALGIYEAHEVVRPELLKRLLGSKNGAVRGYATRMAGMWADRVPEALGWLRERAADEEARVRLEAVVASTYVGKAEAVEIPAVASVNGRDKWIDYALVQSVRALKPQWQGVVGSLDFGGSGVQKEFVKKIGGAVAAVEHPGKATYDAVCLNCHQANGKGLVGIYPPLAGSEWVVGEKSALMRMLLHGLAGPITVKGEPYGTGNPIPMAASGLDDEKIASVLSYVRANFGNNAGAVSVEEVREQRKKDGGRERLWSVGELVPEK